MPSIVDLIILQRNCFLPTLNTTMGVSDDIDERCVPQGEYIHEWTGCEDVETETCTDEDVQTCVDTLDENGDVVTDPTTGDAEQTCTTETVTTCTTSTSEVCTDYSETRYTDPKTDCVPLVQSTDYANNPLSVWARNADTFGNYREMIELNNKNISVMMSSREFVFQDFYHDIER